MEKRRTLTAEELEEGLRGLPGWAASEGRWIEKRFLFPSFMAAVRFVNRVAERAEADDHHPFVSLDYRKVTLRLTTWHSGGLTALDLASAAAYEQLIEP